MRFFYFFLRLKRDLWNKYAKSGKYAKESAWCMVLHLIFLKRICNAKK